MSVCFSTRSRDRSPDLGELCAHAMPSLTRRARMLLPATEVDDVVQETLLAAVTSLHRWRRDASFRTWLNAILRYKVADYYRGCERSPDAVSLDVLETAVLQIEPLTTDYRTGAAVRLTLAELPPDYREILLLRFAEGLPFAEVAQALGISLEAAKSRYRRAKARFAEEWTA